MGATGSGNLHSLSPFVEVRRKIKAKERRAYTKYD
jgi:hypothetical protein